MNPSLCWYEDLSSMLAKAGVSSQPKDSSEHQDPPTPSPIPPAVTASPTPPPVVTPAYIPPPVPPVAAPLMALRNTSIKIPTPLSVPELAALHKPQSPPLAALHKPQSPPLAALHKPQSPPLAALHKPQSPPLAALLKPQPPPLAALLKPQSPPLAPLSKPRSAPLAALLKPQSPPLASLPSAPLQNLEALPPESLTTLPPPEAHISVIVPLDEGPLSLYQRLEMLLDRILEDPSVDRAFIATADGLPLANRNTEEQRIALGVAISTLLETVRQINDEEQLDIVVLALKDPNGNTFLHWFPASDEGEPIFLGVLSSELLPHQTCATIQRHLLQALTHQDRGSE